MGYYHPQNFYFQGKLQGAGGTSIVAPEVAGFFAQANAYMLYVGTFTGGCSGGEACAPLGNGNWYLNFFGLQPTLAPHYPFYDITSGCNINDVTIANHLTPFCAVKGRDEVTGWGSFNFLQLAWAINFDLVGDFGAPVINFTGPALNKWYNTNQTVSWTIYDTSGKAGYELTGVAGFSPGVGHRPRRRRPVERTRSRRRQLLLQRAAVSQPDQRLPRFSGYAGLLGRLRPGLAYGERPGLG